MSDVILCNISDASQTIKEARQYWISNILAQLSVSEEVFDKNFNDFRFELSETYGVEIETRANGEVNIYKKQWNNDSNEEFQGWLPAKKEHLVAQWKEPVRIRKIEGKEIFYELHLNEWSFSG